MEYLFVYGILCSLPVFALKAYPPHYRNNNLRLHILVIMTMMLYVIFRSYTFETGMDYNGYYENYRSYVHGAFTEWGDNREIGYKVLVQCLTKVSASPALFFGFCALLSYGSMILVSSMFRKASWLIMLMWPLFMIVLSENLYRQYISISFILLAYYFWIQKENKYITVLLAVLSVLFHTSALFGIILIGGVYLLKDVRIPRTWLLVAVAISTVFGTVLLDRYLDTLNFVSQMYLSSTGKYYDTSSMLDSYYGESRMIYFVQISNMIVLWYAGKIMENDHKLRFLYYLMALSFFLNPVTRQEILMRVSLYIRCFLPIGYGIVIYSYSKKAQIKYLLLFLAIFFNIIYMMYGWYNHGQSFPLKFL